MREKLLDLMKNEGLKPSQLAEQLEINPAGISHILAGRNKPGFDLLQKIILYSNDEKVLQEFTTGLRFAAKDPQEVSPDQSGLAAARFRQNVSG